MDQITDSKTATQSVLFSGKRKKKKGKTKNNFRGRKKGGKSVGEQNNELVVVDLPKNKVKKIGFGQYKDTAEKKKKFLTRRDGVERR